MKKTIRIRGWPAHRTDGRGIYTGHGASDADIDAVMNILNCWRCWESDERGLLAICAHNNFEPELVVRLRRQVRRSRVNANRN